eukprot:4610311-Alexandrium_andersonii.AAC.1
MSASLRTLSARSPARVRHRGPEIAPPSPPATSASSAGPRTPASIAPAMSPTTPRPWAPSVAG